MTFLLACAALILLLTGHWGWALAVLLLLLLLSPSGKTSSGTGNTPSLKLASYAPEERHEHPAARVRRETTLTPLVRPAGPSDVDYGVDAFAFHDWLASPRCDGHAGGWPGGGRRGLRHDRLQRGRRRQGGAVGRHMLASKDLKARGSTCPAAIRAMRRAPRTSTSSWRPDGPSGCWTPSTTRPPTTVCGWCPPPPTRVRGNRTA